MECFEGGEVGLPQRKASAETNSGGVRVHVHASCVDEGDANYVLGKSKALAGVVSMSRLLVKRRRVGEEAEGR